ncbi:MAG: VOC family protein [Alphaproteobacteria bacterium]|nr:VOC family protein [Alphaproteobacteria bacterium]MDX5370228.1 VOC family protein [Alphaproteobacteria bacterium]MDX5464778.1 VOC family protein [Alphaproteobacteria bacterium]
MTPQIDHIVLATRDLAKAADRFSAMGFTCAPRGVHGWGTSNHVIQFADESFIELLEVDRPQLIAEPDTAAEPPEFSFGAFNRDFLERREGMSMLVLKGQDADADRAKWKAAGLQPYAPFSFERAAKTPDGREGTVGFELAFATDPAMPEAAFFSCRHKAPELFFQPGYQKHGNGAGGLAGVVMVADEPTETADFFKGLMGAEAVARHADGHVSVRMGPHRLRVVTPADFASLFPGERPAGRGGRFAALEVRVASLGVVENTLRAARIDLVHAGGGMFVPASAAFGLTLAFRETA